MGYFNVSRWFSSKQRNEDRDREQGPSLPWPATHSPVPSYSSTPRTPNTHKTISPPIPRPTATSLTGFDNPYLSATPPGSVNELSHYRNQHHNSSLTRLASTSHSNVIDVYGANLSKPQLLAPDDPTERDVLSSLPAVIRIETGSNVTRNPQITSSTAQPIRRTVSSPPMSPAYHPSPTESSSSAEITPTAFAVPSVPSHGGRWNLKLQTDAVGGANASTQSLPNQAGPSVNTDVYGYAYSYPLAKQLSPIQEQDYLSPDSLQRTQSLPVSTGTASRTASDKDLGFSASASPGGSQTSELTRPSPSYSSPFLTRQLNRTASQGSSRTHVSSTSTTLPRHSTKSADTPVIPPLDLRPPFPGPHPTIGPGPHPRQPRMPVISNGTIDEEYEYAATITESLHAESFVTATSNDRHKYVPSVREIEVVDHEALIVNTARGEGTSIRSHESRKQSAGTDSYVTPRWDRDVPLGTGVRTIRAKKQYLDATPAFWTFWLGFLCPVFWLIGGWHFTHFGEQPPRLTFWEFYFNAGYWKEMCCGKRNKKREMDDQARREGKGKVKVEPPPLPRWVAEKQASEDGRARLNDPKRSLKGISFGYPFIPRPVPVKEEDMTVWNRVWTRVLEVLDKPNRIFDQLYGVKLREVRGRPESRRRCFDPWIQRCRYALCYAMFFLAIGLCVASAYLIVYNTRQLR
ncbi:hypothetical protein CC1G_06930 [Coprinopsis cinerea okayama7|uniref:Uncharacterized protein n=1 Tax=Coprinopsis cinerea (strain Okayama-7 / 130 / ATCC MYA-4618 / FGSC 9003) TaxID=240176 RepID=A8NZQ6_COPC7|nr:hypothetical protein CC1G_06930 [Coprinopsis cinerea okayama7\|eukprot:XP_001837724.1 hypothetical protein CC1G_06930 [Coprinopsis cinerea okayama7\